MRSQVIGRIYGLSRKGIPDDAIGVEVEAEGPRRLDQETVNLLDEQGIRVTTDGSLRNGLEFITPPIPYSTLTEFNGWPALAKALHEMRAVSDSVRTSTHVHLNMRNKTFLEVVTFAVTYWSLEQCLLRLCSEFRRGNMFALSITDSQTILSLITEAFNNDRTPPLTNNEHKYSSFNFVPLQRFGTVEIRIMHGLTEVDQVIDWALLCGAIRVLASQFKDPADVLSVKPKELFDRFMGLVSDNNHWKKLLKELDTEYPLEVSREILESWTYSKDKSFWHEGGTKTYPNNTTRYNALPELDFSFAEEPFTPVDIKEDL